MEKSWIVSAFDYIEKKDDTLKERRELKKELIDKGYKVKTGQNDLPMARVCYWIEWEKAK